MIYIVILNWNGWEDTIDCIKSIFEMDYNNYKIILIENGSTNNSKVELSYYFVNNNYDVEIFYNEAKLYNLRKKISIYIGNENKGFSGGVNIGLKAAIKDNVEFVWILNNDTIVTKNSLEMLVKNINNSNYVGLSPIIRDYNDNTIWSQGSKITWYGAVKRDPINIINPNSKIMPVDFITNCASLYRLDLFKDTGLLSEDIFVGEDDYELSLRIKKKSFKVGRITDSIIFHKVGQSSINVDYASSLYTDYIIKLLGIKKHFRKIIYIILLFVLPIKFMIIVYKQNQYSLSSIIRNTVSLVINSIVLDKVDKEKYFKFRNIFN